MTQIQTRECENCIKGQVSRLEEQGGNGNGETVDCIECEGRGYVETGPAVIRPGGYGFWLVRLPEDKKAHGVYFYYQHKYYFCEYHLRQECPHIEAVKAMEQPIPVSRVDLDYLLKALTELAYQTHNPEQVAWIADDLQERVEKMIEAKS